MGNVPAQLQQPLQRGDESGHVGDPVGRRGGAGPDLDAHVTIGGEDLEGVLVGDVVAAVEGLGGADDVREGTQGAALVGMAC